MARSTTRRPHRGDGRLTSAPEFRRVLRGGRSRRCGALVVHVRDRDGGGRPRLGLVVPRAVGTAVDRNRVKRRIRAIWQELSCSAAPIDCVVVVRPEARTARFPTLAAQLEGSLKTMRVLKEANGG